MNKNNERQIRYRKRFKHYVEQLERAQLLQEVNFARELSIESNHSPVAIAAVLRHIKSHNQELILGKELGRNIIQTLEVGYEDVSDEELMEYLK
ncbi:MULTISPECIES: hypothetical protein [Vibrio]|uniref:hypothetical protein n=1 Tax=Vibrio TaxID=662 RepID=UPI0006351E57|nr:MULTISPECIES: hypothetical protein [Vibrio]OCH61894.1 hypothetical protein A6D94_17115 [Vibrio splendidus]CDT47809.1 hypothetical protein VCR6J2_470083 [Vibrio coralliirubri]